MQSDNETPKNDSDVSSGRNVALLRREVPVVERQRSMVLAGLLSFAGVALGFGLGQLSAADRDCAHSVVVQSASAPQRAHSAHSFAPRHNQQQGFAWLGVVYEGHGGQGAYIRRVIPGSPAEAAGLRQGERILAVGGQPLAARDALGRSVRRLNAGEEVRLRVQDQDGNVQTRQVTLGAISRSEFGEAFRRH